MNLPVKDDVHHLVDEPRRSPRIVDQGPLPLLFLDRFDDRVLQHRFYGLCCWLAAHPGWRPTSAAHPRPDGKPFYLAPNCPGCGTPLVLLDSLERPPLPPNKVWYDEWICPNWPPPNGGVWMDWPAGEWAAAIDKAETAIAAGEYARLEGGHERQVALDDRGMFPGTLAP